MKKNRVPISEELSAEIKWKSNYVCCICNIRGLSTQIHHINDDPSDNLNENLALLCLECHNATQIRGGFGRQLNSMDVRKAKIEWENAIISRRNSSKTDRDEAEIRRPADRTFSEADLGMLVSYVQTIPIRLSAAQAAAQTGWGTTTRDIAVATWDVIDEMIQIWLYLAKWYPSHHFGDVPAERFISETVTRLSILHRALAEPEGPGSGGTIVSVIVPSAVLAESVSIVRSTVLAMVPQDSIDIESWLDALNHAQHPKPLPRPSESITENIKRFLRMGRRFWC